MLAGVAPTLAAAEAMSAAIQTDEPYHADVVDSVLIEKPEQAPRVERPVRPQAKASVQCTSVARRRTAPRSGFNVTSAKIRGPSGSRVAVADVAVANQIVREREAVTMPTAAVSAIAKAVNAEPRVAVADVAVTNQIVREREAGTMHTVAVSAIANADDAEPRLQPIFDDWKSAAAIAESAFQAYDGWSRSTASLSGSGSLVGEMAASASLGLSPLPGGAQTASVTGARVTERVAAPVEVQSTATGVAIVTASETAAGASFGRGQPILPARVVPAGSDAVTDPWSSAWFGHGGSTRGSITLVEPISAANAFDATSVAAPRDVFDTGGTRVSEVRPDAASVSSREVW